MKKFFLKKQREELEVDDFSGYDMPENQQMLNEAGNIATDIIDIGHGDRKIFATVNGKTAGELYLFPEKGQLHIELVKVLPNFRGQGIAGILLERAVEVSKTERKDITLMASPVGKDASLSKDQLVKLYGKYGFKVYDDSDELNTYMIRRH
ncbi:GNAT family N-acetyltransferase [Chryseobacterium phage MA9V-2]|nr:GNAT family N-acetyltransferase [Chryseobacterium phage MA9V-2]